MHARLNARWGGASTASRLTLPIITLYNGPVTFHGQTHYANIFPALMC